ncbi:flagellar basal body P-ring biosynthesis protein FlgA [Pseudomonas putida S11]|nr:flagellar basal body P-ring biosynthesis protein FlgA [Pseudomonas putida S11]
MLTMRSTECHQEALGLGVVLGDDHETVARVFLQRPQPGGHRQVEDRDGRPANIGNTAHHRVRLGQQGQRRALQHFPDLEYVDAVKLLAIEAEQQQFQAILPHQLRALVDRIHNTCHARLLYVSAFRCNSGSESARALLF